ASISGSSRAAPFVTAPTQPSAFKMLTCTQPRKAPVPGCSSMSCITTTRGDGILVMCFHKSVRSTYQLPTMGGSADRTLQVAAYPTRGGKLLKRQRKPAVENPSFRNLTPKDSMASDITHVPKDWSWLIWSDVNGVCKIYPSWRRF